MNQDYIFNIRITGILIENNEILLVQQKLSDKRNWSLPGGRLERGETLAQGIIREMKEETGLDVKFVPISELEQYGFSEKFIQVINDGFSNAGNYVGDKINIGLGI